MARVLIPITEPAGAQRAVAKLLAEPRDSSLSVHLLAAVEALRPGKVRIFVTEQEATSQVRAAARRWLTPIEAALDAAHIPYTSQIVVGPTRATVRAATMSEDNDRVLLPTAEAQCFSQRERTRLSENLQHPVTLVA